MPTPPVTHPNRPANPPAVGDLLDAPLAVTPSTQTIRVAVCVPCFNRPDDLAALTTDLRTCQRSLAIDAQPYTINLSVYLVDNASDPPLSLPDFGPTIACHLYRPTHNLGGSGGFNLAMAHALHNPSLDYLCLLDSDARIQPDTLAKLIHTLHTTPTLVMVGPSITDPASNDIHEQGGLLNPVTGRFGPRPFTPLPPSSTAPSTPILCDYIPACCALVRADAARSVGLMPDTFLNADDVQWCIELTRHTNQHIAVLPDAKAAHPRFNRLSPLARYMSSRNVFGPIAASNLSRRVVFTRAMLETCRAINQHLMGRHDLAAHHMQGLRDRANNITSGLPNTLPNTLPSQPLTAALSQTSPTSLPPLAARLLGIRPQQAIVPAKGSPAYWLAAATTITIEEPPAPNQPATCTRTHPRILPCLIRAISTLLRGLALSVRLALRSPTSLRTPLPTPELVVATAPTTNTATPASTQPHPTTTSLTCAAIILSYNRADALNTTLTRLVDMRKLNLFNLTELIIVDNASNDNSAAMVNAFINKHNATNTHHDPPLTIKLIALETNTTIKGFNLGVQHASAQTVLILDDDARPDPHALAQALSLLAKRPDLGAITFEPVHPQTGTHEWPFAHRLSAPTDHWPVMGCCNLIRRDLWQALGGYQSHYQLYRNDMDLAMTILATGMGVHFNPNWICEHDSPVAARKSLRWFNLATRNWLWLCARHSSGITRLLASTLGVLHAHKLAGLSPLAHANILKGTLAALAHKAPPLPRGISSTNTTMKHYLHLRR